MLRRQKRVIAILLLSCLTACSHNLSPTESNPDLKENTISVADVEEREDTILTTTADESFVFDFNNTTYKNVAVWIETYEAGELVDDQLGYMTKQALKKGSVIVTSEKANDKKQQQTFNIGIGDKGGTASTTISSQKPKNLEDMSVVAGALPNDMSLDNGDIVLASIAYADDQYGVSSISSNFYKDPEAHKDELAEYDVVYLFKAEFMD